MKQLEFAIYFRSKFAVKKQLRYFQPTGAIMWLHTGIKVTTWRPLAYSYIVFLCSFCVLQFSFHNFKSFLWEHLEEAFGVTFGKGLKPYFQAV